MDNAGKFSHALYAVLYAAQNTGCDLNQLVHIIKRDIIGHNSIRPLPQDQAAVIRAIEDAINDISR